MSALLIIDMQNDFMPGGALPVPKGDTIIPLINQLIDKFPHVIATQDWHPVDHVSFAANHPGKKPGEFIEVKGMQQILWPLHCVMNTKGAELVGPLKKEKIAAIFFKGSDKWVDSYSAFFDNARLRKTGLEDYLKKQGIKELYVVGVATDYCVLYSVLDALELGLNVKVIEDACCGINLAANEEQRALDLMEKNGAYLVEAQAVLKQLASDELD